LSYRLVYTQRAVRDIDRLEAGVKKRIGAAILRYIDNPLLHSERLTETDLGGYRFRIGDYRVIFDLEERDIVVLRVGHRKDIYKRK
jgi:mRNA interferase RelE/StbE